MEHRRRDDQSEDARQETAPGATEVSPESVDLIKVILLGGPGVGKTSIIQVRLMDKVARICVVSAVKADKSTGEDEKCEVNTKFSRCDFLKFE